MIEAMACGTPVLAFRCGSVPEIIEDGLTGAIVDSVDEAIAALPRVIALDRKKVRQRFEQRFSATRMAKDYVDVYRSLLASSQSAAGGATILPAPGRRYGATNGSEASDCLSRTRPCNAGRRGSRDALLHSGHRSSTRPRRTLKHGDCFAVLDSYADIGAVARRPGRHFLLRHALSLASRIAAQRQAAAAARLERARRQLDPHRRSDQPRHLPRPASWCSRKTRCTSCARFFCGTAPPTSGCAWRITATAPFDVQLSLAFASDFADLFEVRGLRRAASRHRERSASATPSVTVRLSGSRRHSAAHHARGSSRRRNSCRAASRSYAFELAAARQSASIYVTVTCERGAEETRRCRFARACARRSSERRAASRGMATIDSSNEIFNEVLCRSMADLAMLTTDTPQGPYPYAGIPWYSTTFGRDGIITALQMLWCDPRIAKGVLRRLAAYQADATSIRCADAEPGKILHEMRGGEMAALREVPFGLYYGSVDATPLFVHAGRALCRAHRRRRDAARALAQHRGGAWLDRRSGRSPTATASSNITAPTRTGSPTRAGRTPTTRSSTPTARWRRGRSRSARCRAMSMPPSAWRRAARAGSARRVRGQALDAQADSARRALRGGVLVRRHRHLRAGARRTESGPAACAPPMPARCCSAASPRPSARTR